MIGGSRRLTSAIRSSGAWFRFIPLKQRNLDLIPHKVIRPGANQQSPEAEVCGPLVPMKSG